MNSKVTIVIKKAAEITGKLMVTASNKGRQLKNNTRTDGKKDH